MYALAASATGVSLLALVQPSAAKIVYTPANVVIKDFSHYQLDVNHDGIPDFSFFRSSNATTTSMGQFIGYGSNPVGGVQKSNAVVVGNMGFPRAFAPGITIGPKQKFAGSGQMWGCFKDANGYRHSGNWKFVQNRYLGLRFTITGQIHYGWARLSTGITYCGDFYASVTLTGYAYETIPNKHIVTGKTKGPDEAEPTASLNTPTHEPATLGILALGAPVLSIWRREESLLSA
jgi:hypothetical protein